MTNWWVQWLVMHLRFHHHLIYMAERFSVKILHEMDLGQLDTNFSSKPSYATSTCKSELAHKVHVTYLQVTIWRCSRYTHSPWMQKFLYSISQGVPFFLFFPLFFFLLDLPAFFSPPLFVVLGLTTGSTEKRTRGLSLVMLNRQILWKWNKIWESLHESLWLWSLKCKRAKTWVLDIQHKCSKFRSSLSSTLIPLSPEQCRQIAAKEDGVDEEQS